MLTNASSSIDALLESVVSDKDVTVFFADTFDFDLKHLMKNTRSLLMIDVLSLPRDPGDQFRFIGRATACLIIMPKRSAKRKFLSLLDDWIVSNQINCINATLVEQVDSVGQSSAHLFLKHNSIRQLATVMIHKNKTEFVIRHFLFDCVSRQYTTQLQYNSSRHCVLPSSYGITSGLDLTKMEFRISTTSYANTTFAYFKIEDGQRKLYGAEIVMIGILSELFGFRVRYVDDPPTSMFGELLPNGSWTGVVGKVYRNEADLGIGDLSITAPRMEYVDFTFPFHIEPNVFVFHKPESESRLGVILEPFRLSLWLTIVASLLFVFILFSSTPGIIPYKKKIRRTAEAGMFLWGSLIEQAVIARPRKGIGRMVVILWWFFSLIVTTNYKSELTSRLSVEKYPPPINTLEQLAASSLNVILPKGFAINPYLETLSLTNPHIKSILERRAFIDLEKGFKESSFTKDSVYINEMNLISRQLSSSLSKGLYVVPNYRFFTTGFGWTMRKGMCYKDFFNKAMLYMSQSGIPLHLMEELVGLSEITQSVEKPINLVDTAIAFVILGSGLTVSTLVLLVEIMCGNFFGKKSQSYEKRNNKIYIRTPERE